MVTAITFAIKSAIVASAIIREPPERSFRELPGFLAVGILYGLIMILFPKFATWLPGFV